MATGIGQPIGGEKGACDYTSMQSSGKLSLLRQVTAVTVLTTRLDLPLPVDNVTAHRERKRSKLQKPFFLKILVTKQS